MSPLCSMFEVMFSAFPRLSETLFQNEARPDQTTFRIPWLTWYFRPAPFPRAKDERNAEIMTNSGRTSKGSRFNVVHNRDDIDSYSRAHIRGQVAPGSWLLASLMNNLEVTMRRLHLNL
ncbi:hypothetical protein E4U53_002749 [Claviceps sorghi]|nr:hypothetical protein E4U53_002749 [Claviceps sorghi]